MSRPKPNPIDQDGRRTYQTFQFRDGEIPTARLVSHVFDFADYRQAFRTVGCDIAHQTMAPLETPNCKVLLRLADIH
ncbi:MULTISPECIES: hypothetical protein [Burkholderia]|uniref:Uncharacterized protein n=1 Tax=Burkholderia savannae TaxID=1637837 RepID=A0ABR5TD93_9BURK|nr:MULTISPECIES: hypothetical protein [Burkholderia]AOJ80614.1 hypothetical protein WS86_08310 [Burkholderia savannae]KVK73330.1 hypothetical protein WS91_21210 [Burkholderia sp. MSMB1498]KWZ42870.1 hypothetical protein WS72_08360 [Burkholderia savannae]KWZ45890.1 hypothetical protein WS73_17455 [Burkholderia savannae]